MCIRDSSQGHSDAIRRVEGVKDGKQYTIPVEAALEAVRNGENPELTTRQKHTRECFVVLEDGADAAKVEETIKNMPNYFSDYDTTVHFISEEELKAKHSGIHVSYTHLDVYKRQRFALLRWIAKIYISIMRGTPLMLQLLVVFFAPYYVFGISTPYMYRLYAVIIGFSLNYAAYFAEIYRSGIQSIPQGQREAAQVMGYGRQMCIRDRSCKVYRISSGHSACHYGNQRMYDARSR